MTQLAVFFRTADLSVTDEAIDYFNSLPTSAGGSGPPTNIVKIVAYANPTDGYVGRTVQGKYFVEFVCEYTSSPGLQGPDILNMILPADAEIVFYQDEGNGFN